MPLVPPFEIRSLVTPPNPPKARVHYHNPNAPVIDVESRGVAGAVIFLRKVDPSRARPWDHPPVSVEHADRRLYVVQGDNKTNVGIVHQGDKISMVSREKIYNSLHADGAAFFTFPFPDADKPLTRALTNPGFVELSSAAGFYWMRAYLFVSEHPYVTRTDAKGNFELAQVPPGKYQIVCWLPNWNKKSQDRDPESSLVTRMFFQSPLEVERDVVVDANGEVRMDFVVSSELAAKR
ncbi:MAG TPA: carboxypeptidase-like regulatory domain-containing protein [Gemmataceae bacterium]|nr:carboxypeptidase-like regulatory domain-containing protein [Gemmataceae bacterium]